MPCLSARPERGPDLNLEAGRDGDGETGRDRVAGTGFERQSSAATTSIPAAPASRVGRRRQARRRAARRFSWMVIVHTSWLSSSRRLFDRPFLAGPLAARSSISWIASSSVTSAGSIPRGKVALVDAVGDIRPVATGHHLDLAVARRDGLPSTAIGSRLPRPPSALAAAASASFVTAAFMPVSNTSAVEPSRAYLPSCARYGP